MAPLPAEREPCCPLTARELEVLCRVAQGMTAREVGACLHITEKSAKNCVSRIIQKLGVAHRTAAVVLAHQRRWLNLDILPLAGAR
jgi:DNA-binding CsgD family transcriptional regulator